MTRFDNTTVSAARSGGFTLIELVVVIVVLGIISVTAFSRLEGTEPFEAVGFRDELVSAARDAQRYARSSGCQTTFTINANTYTVSTTVPCGGASQTVSGPGGAITGSAPAGVTVGNATVVFDAYGAATSSASITVSAGSDSAGFSIQAGSGYVDLP